MSLNSVGWPTIRFPGRFCEFPCDDGLDNDQDGFVDYPADPGCQEVISEAESPQCQDGVNNDNHLGTDFDGGESILGVGNGDPDGPDPQCVGAPWLNSEIACGLGFELALLLPGLMWLRRRRRSRSAHER